MKKILALAALLGVAGAATVADAAPAAATLVSVTSYSNNGSLAWNLSLDTSTWTFDTVTGTAVETGGTYSALTKAGVLLLMRHTMTGVTLGNFSPTGATWACIEGNFGQAVGASVCGNYNIGTNLTNESTYTPTTTGATVTIGGDDGIVGPPQTLVNSFSTMTAFLVAGAPAGSQRYCLSNTNASVAADKCLTLDPASPNASSGYDFLFEVSAVQVPATVVIGGCDSGVPNYNVVPGTTLNDAIGQCPTTNHGKFVSCVSALTNEWKRAGLITGAQKGAIMGCAAKAH